MSGPGEVQTSARRGPDRNAQAALAVFVLLVAVAGPLILYWNRRQWFFLDEWDFLSGRQLFSVHDLLAPHNEHWSTIPIVLYRVLWRFVGLHHYWPYQVPVVVAHLSACVLLRVIMRRAGADPWIATVAAVSLLFFGRGREDLAWGFQVGFTGALAFGLAQLVVSDHDGRVGRRDGVALVLGLAALLCSGVGVALVGVVGLSVLLRRGWQAALLQVVPLVVAFGVWRLVLPPATSTPTAGLGDTLTLFRRTLTRTLVALGGSTLVGVLLAVVVVVGLVEIARTDGWRSVRGQLSPVVACGVGAVGFAAMVAPGRAGLSLDPAGRYLHVTAALALPLIAVTASALTARWRVLLPVMIVLIGAGLPANVDLVKPGPADAFTVDNSQQILVLAQAALESGAPRDVRLQPGLNEGFTVGWLVDGRRSGRIPPPDQPIDPNQWANARLQLAFRPLDGAARPAQACRPLGPGTARLAVGQRIVVEGRGGFAVTGSLDGGAPATVGFGLIPVPGDASGEGRGELQVLRPMMVAVSVPDGRASVCG